MPADASYLAGIWGFDYDQNSGEFAGRLAGRNILVGYGKNFLGKPLRELYPKPIFELAHAEMTRTVAEPACVRYFGKLFRVGGQVIDGERLVLPVGDDPDHPDGLVGAAHYDHFMVTGKVEDFEPLWDLSDWCRV
jgi:hypothetical protein